MILENNKCSSYPFPYAPDKILSTIKSSDTSYFISQNSTTKSRNIAFIRKDIKT